jgi:hypothetical protein
LGTIHCNISPGSHSDTDISFSQGWCIIDAITSHSHDATFLLQFADQFEFICGFDFAMYLINA